MEEELKCKENCFECEHLQNGIVDGFCPSKVNLKITIEVIKKLIELEQKINFLYENATQKQGKTQKVEIDINKTSKKQK